jgi:hypothetical protein
MKKYVAICGMVAALAWVGVAAATVTPQGRLDGSAAGVFGGTLTITTPVLDGGMDPLYIGKENDQSGNCDGDTGTVMLNQTPAPIVCSHYVASSHDGSGPKMRFAFQDPTDANCYYVFRISDAGPTDKVGGIYFCTTRNPLDLARSAVNRGTSGGGLETPWTFTTVDGYTITADQT